MALAGFNCPVYVRIWHQGLQAQFIRNLLCRRRAYDKFIFMGRTKAVSVAGGRTWLIGVQFRELGEGKPRSSKQVIIPVEEIGGMSPEEIGNAVVELGQQARRFY